MPERITDERLLERAAGGDEAAFRELYERHRDAIFRFAYRLLGASPQAEDVTHDCFLSLLRQPERFDPTRAALRTYLYAAARNLATKYFRQYDREVDDAEFAEEPRLAATEEPLRKLLNEELAVEVGKAIASLPPLQREALVLFEYEELTLAEISIIVGAGTGTIKARLHRARERLRRELAPYVKSGRSVVTLEKA